MRLPRNLFARIAPMNLKMRKCLIINNRILRFMGRIADNEVSDGSRPLVLAGLRYWARAGRRQRGELRSVGQRFVGSSLFAAEWLVGFPLKYQALVGAPAQVLCPFPGLSATLPDPVWRPK